jgi:WD40 repeat protein
VAVTADGRRAVSASSDKTLKVWDLDSGRPVAAFHGDQYFFCCVATQRSVVGGDVGGQVHFLVLEFEKPYR